MSDTTHSHGSNGSSVNRLSYGLHFSKKFLKFEMNNNLQRSARRMSASRKRPTFNHLLLGVYQFGKVISEGINDTRENY